MRRKVGREEHYVKATTEAKKALPLSKGERVMIGVCCLSYKNEHLKALFICLVFNSKWLS